MRDWTLVLPVQIVELELDELHLRVLRQNAVQHVRLVVEGEAQAADAALGLLLRQKFEGAQPPGDLIAGGGDGVEQVVVEVRHAALVQLLLEEGRLLLLRVLGPEVEQGHLVRQEKPLPGVALHQGPADDVLALPAVVHVGGVEVGVAPLQETVHHGAHLGLVHPALLLGVRHGQAHHAKA